MAGGGASMVDIQGPFTDLRTFVNGGNFDETNVPNLSAAFTAYRQIAQFSGVLPSGTAAGTYVSGYTANALVLTLAQLGVATYLDPSMFAANTRTTKYRLRTMIAVNATPATGVTFTPGMYSIASIQGGAGIAPFVATAGTVTGSNGATVVSPAANSINPVDSGDFNAPSAGAFMFGTVTNAAIPANSAIAFVSQLFMRQV